MRETTTSKKKMYLETSVPSAYYDDRSPKREAQTREFWQGLDLYAPFSSDLVEKEVRKLEQYGDKHVELMVAILALVEEHSLLRVTEAVNQLADEYVKQGVVSSRMRDDARHLALATINEMDFLVSWNFKHLVRSETRERVRQINKTLGYASFIIASPIDFLEGGKHYEPQEG